MGSVKDLGIIEPAFENKVGIGDFVFSDRYSIFDWGQMPNHIDRKGEALAIMAAFNFEELEKRGVRTHYKGLVLMDDSVVKFNDLKEGVEDANVMRVDMAVVYEPSARKFMVDGNNVVKYDYAFFNLNRGKINNYLVPLEIIFRNALPKGSSIFDKIAEAKAVGSTRDQRVLQELLGTLGLEKEPNPGDVLPRPVYDYTTKLEAGDRVISEIEAFGISGLREEDFMKVQEIATQVNHWITEQAENAGMVHYDGKVEMVYNSGLVLCDVLGTFDENRLGFNGEQVSKEFLRQWYKKNQPEFGKACKRWKESGEGWQERCPVKPINLPNELATLVSQMYMAGCNQYVQKRIFNVPKLEEVMEKIRPYRSG